MRKLASNVKAALFICGNEYWVVARNPLKAGMTPNDLWNICCYEERSDRYNATKALAHFQETYGMASWIHPEINTW